MEESIKGNPAIHLTDEGVYKKLGAQAEPDGAERGVPFLRLPAVQGVSRLYFSFHFMYLPDLESLE